MAEQPAVAANGTELQPRAAATDPPPSSAAEAAAAAAVDPVVKEPAGPQPPRPPYVALLAITLLETPCGICNSVLGPMLPAIANLYGLGSGASALVFSVFYLGGICGDLSVLLPLEFRTHWLVQKLGMDEDVRAGQRALCYALVLIALSSFLLWALPDTIGGSSSAAFAVFLMLVWVFGIGSDTLDMAASTITSTWDERVLGAAINIFSFGFAVGAVLAPFVFTAITDLAARESSMSTGGSGGSGASAFKTFFLAFGMYCAVLLPWAALPNLRDPSQPADRAHLGGLAHDAEHLVTVRPLTVRHLPRPLQFGSWAATVTPRTVIAVVPEPITPLTAGTLGSARARGSSVSRASPMLTGGASPALGALPPPPPVLPAGALGTVVAAGGGGGGGSGGSLAVPIQSRQRSGNSDHAGGNSSSSSNPSKPTTPQSVMRALRPHDDTKQKTALEQAVAKAMAADSPKFTDQFAAAGGGGGGTTAGNGVAGSAAAPAAPAALTSASAIIAAATAAGQPLPPVPPSPALTPTSAQVRYVGSLLRSPMYWLLVAVVLCATGAQYCFGDWFFSLAVEYGYDDGHTGTQSSALFWAGLLCGRLIIARLSAAYPTARGTMLLVLAICLPCIGAPLCLIASTSRANLLVWSFVIGFSVAGLFPLLLALCVNSQLFTDPYTHSNAMPIGALIIAANTGAILFPLLLGMAADAVGVIRWCIPIGSGGFVAMALLLLAFYRQYHGPQPLTLVPSKQRGLNALAPDVAAE